MIDEKDERLPLLGRKLKTFGHTLREKSARFRMWPGADGSRGVVQEECEIKNKRVFQIFEEMTISDQLRIACSNQCIELIDAKKGVFVRGVAVKKFMLHQTGQLAKLRNITAEIIDPVHETERAADLAFPGQDLFE